MEFFTGAYSKNVPEQVLCEWIELLASRKLVDLQSLDRVITEAMLFATESSGQHVLATKKKLVFTLAKAICDAAYEMRFLMPSETGPPPPKKKSRKF